MDFRGPTCDRARTATSSTPCTTCTTEPAGPACARWPRRRGAATPRSRRSSPRLGFPPGEPSSSSSRRWMVTRPISTSSGWPHHPRRRHPADAAADRRPTRRARRGPPPPGERRGPAAGHRRGRDREDQADEAAPPPRRGADCAGGSCLPLSTDVPLLPISASCVGPSELDGGTWFRPRSSVVRRTSEARSPSWSPSSTHAGSAGRPAAGLGPSRLTTRSLPPLRPRGVCDHWGCGRGPPLGGRQHPRSLEHLLAAGVWYRCSGPGAAKTQRRRRRPPTGSAGSAGCRP